MCPVPAPLAESVTTDRAGGHGSDETESASRPDPKLALRVDVACETLDQKIGQLMKDIAHHEVWVTRVRDMADAMEGEDRVTQDRVVEAVSGRLATLRAQCDRLEHDQAILHREGALAIGDAGRPSGSLSRLLAMHAPDAEVNLRCRPSGPDPAAVRKDLRRLRAIAEASERRAPWRRLGGSVGVARLLGLCVLGWVAFHLMAPAASFVAPDLRRLALPQDVGGSSLPAPRIRTISGGAAIRSGSL